MSEVLLGRADGEPIFANLPAGGRPASLPHHRILAEPLAPDAHGRTPVLMLIDLGGDMRLARGTIQRLALEHACELVAHGYAAFVEPM